MDIAALLLTALLGSVQYPPIESVQVHDGASWTTMHWRKVNPQKRLLVVRAQVTLPDTFDKTAEPFGVHIAAPISYEAWWNGVRVGSNGVPAARAQNEIPGKIDTEIFIPPHLLAKDNVLTLRMSTFHLARTLARPMQYFGVHRYGSTGGEAARRLWLPFAAGGALLLGTAYFAAMFFSNRRDRTSLVLALLALAILGQLAAESVRSFISYPYPLHILRVETILGCAVIASVLLVGYIAHRYARALRTHFVVAIGVVAGAIVVFIPGYDDKTGSVLLVATLLSVAASVVGVRKRVPGARTALIAMAVALTCFFIDASAFLDRNYYLAATVLLLVLFAQQVVALREAQRLRARLELELLKQQIQPHFLMNSLTALTEWIESDPKTGVKMIEALAEEFRAIATMSGASTVSLREELALCRHHLQVMSLRKDQTFDLRSPDVDLDARVPPAIFHTLLENALTHNAYTDGATFVLEESRDTRGRRTYRLHTPLSRDPTPEIRVGKGHSYVQARLGEVFGDRWRFSSGQAGPHEWLDAIEVPVH